MISIMIVRPMNFSTFANTTIKKVMLNVEIGSKNMISQLKNKIKTLRWQLKIRQLQSVFLLFASNAKEMYSLNSK